MLAKRLASHTFELSECGSVQPAHRGGERLGMRRKHGYAGESNIQTEQHGRRSIAREHAVRQHY